MIVSYYHCLVVAIFWFLFRSFLISNRKGLFIRCRLVCVFDFIIPEMSNKREFSGSFDETNLDVKKPKRTIQDFFVPSIASKQVPVSEAVAGNSTDVGEVVSVPSASAESSSSPQLPEFHLFIDNVRNLSDSGIPLDDFGYAVKIVSEGVYTLSDSDIHHFLKKRWQPHNKEEFPVSYHTKNGKVRPRSLNSRHMEQFPWLAVSRLQQFEGAWCAMCVLFKTSDEGGGWSGTGQRMGRLVLKALTDFSDLTGNSGSLSSHALSQYHRACADRAAHFLQQFGQPGRDIRNRLSSARMQQVEQNRSLLRPQVDILKLCAVQNIPLRGHRDDGDLGNDVIQPENDGNYRHLLRFRMASGDEALKTAINRAGANAKHSSKTVQNELLTVMGSMVKDCVTQRVKRAQVWSVLADETTDRSSREQMVLVARYVDLANNVYVVREDPFCVTDVFAEINSMVNGEGDNSGDTEVKLSGTNLGRLILLEIGKANLDTATCVGQGYDKASAMASEASGAAAFVKETAHLAEYFHCISHATNLSCSKCTNNPFIRNAQDIMAQVINSFNSSAKRVNLLKKHAKQTGCAAGKLIGLCTTRFIERHASVARFWDVLPAIVCALHEQQSWADRDASTKAHTLLCCLEKSDTLVSLACLNAIASIMKPLAQALQKKGGDLVRALHLVDDTTNVLQKMRSGDETVEAHCFSSIFSEVSTMAQRIGVTLQKPRTPGGKSVHRAAAGAEEGIEDYYRINVFNAAIDAVLVDFRARFSQHA